MSDSVEIGTSEASEKDAGATAGCGKRPRAESTERNLKSPGRQWHRAMGAKGKKYAPETRTASSSPVRGQGRDKYRWVTARSEIVWEELPVNTRLKKL
ncbi:hypothetical protein MTO96_043052 [Rhipicephalus appendiculatus]